MACGLRPDALSAIWSLLREFELHHLTTLLPPRMERGKGGMEKKENGRRSARVAEERVYSYKKEEEEELKEKEEQQRRKDSFSTLDLDIKYKYSRLS